MAGLFTLSSSPDANVGVNRYLTMEPPISDPRGFIDNKTAQGKIDEYTDVNLFGIAEALTTGCASGDDSPRTTMTCRQSTHCVATAKASPVLISNGSDRVMPYHVSKDWVFSAKEDGVVKEYDKTNNLFIVQYESGECEAIELTRIAKNGAGGFNLSKTMNVNFKKGDKFKKNDILAYDNKFFSEKYVVLKGAAGDIPETLKEKLIGFHAYRNGFEALIDRTEIADIPDVLEYEKASIDEILVYIAKEDKHERRSKDCAV